MHQKKVNSMIHEANQFDQIAEFNSLYEAEGCGDHSS